MEDRFKINLGNSDTVANECLHASSNTPPRTARPLQERCPKCCLSCEARFRSSTLTRVAVSSAQATYPVLEILVRAFLEQELDAPSVAILSEGPRFRVWGSGCRDYDFGFRV